MARAISNAVYEDTVQRTPYCCGKQREGVISTALLRFDLTRSITWTKGDYFSAQLSVENGGYHTGMLHYDKPSQGQGRLSSRFAWQRRPEKWWLPTRSWRLAAKERRRPSFMEQRWPPWVPFSIDQTKWSLTMCSNNEHICHNDGPVVMRRTEIFTSHKIWRTMVDLYIVGVKIVVLIILYMFDNNDRDVLQHGLRDAVSSRRKHQCAGPSYLMIYHSSCSQRVRRQAHNPPWFSTNLERHLARDREVHLGTSASVLVRVLTTLIPSVT